MSLLDSWPLDEVCNAVVRRQWLNQILSWCIRGSINKVEYSRDEIISIIVNEILINRDLVDTIPEATKVLQMFRDGLSAAIIEKYLRMVL